MNETIKRVLIALIAIPIILALLFYSREGFLLLFLITFVFTALEVISIAEIKTIHVYKSITIITGIIIILLAYFSTRIEKSIPLSDQSIFVVLLLSLFLIFLMETFSQDFNKTIENVSTHILIVIYTGVAISYIIKIQAISPYYFLYIIFITWMTDTGAYFSGKYMGKHKLNWKASPNKTGEGFVGGIITAILSALLLKLLFPNEFPENKLLFSYLGIIIMTFGLSIFGIFGDLAASILKRSSGIKDSKTYIPGHGGFLDVMDSLLYNAPIFYFLLYCLLEV